MDSPTYPVASTYAMSCSTAPTWRNLHSVCQTLCETHTVLHLSYLKFLSSVGGTPCQHAAPKTCPLRVCYDRNMQAGKGLT